MESVSNRNSRLLTLLPLRHLRRILDAALLLALFAAGLSGCYLAVIFIEQVRGVAFFSESTPLFRELLFFNRYALIALATLTVVRVGVLFAEPGRLVKYLSLRVVGPMLMGMIALASLFVLLSTQISRVDETSVPETAARTVSVLLRSLFYSYSRETFDYARPLATDLTEMLRNESFGGAGFRLETEVEAQSLIAAGIIDISGRFILAAPDSTLAGSQPVPAPLTRRLNDLAYKSRVQELDQDSLFDIELIDYADSLVSGTGQFTRLILPLGEFSVLGGAKPLLLLLDAPLPSQFTDVNTGLNSELRTLNAQIAHRTGLIAIFFQLTLNATLVTMYIALALVVYVLRRHGRRLLDLAASMDKITSEVPGGTAVQSRSSHMSAAQDEISNVIESFHEMTERRNELISDLSSNHDFLKGVLENIDAGVIVLDNQNRVLSSTERCQQLLGHAPRAGEMLDQYFRRLPDASVFADSIEAMMHNEPVSLQIAERNLLVSATELPRTAGHGRILAIADISAPLAESHIAAWTEALQRFLHEIKNPLQPLLLAAEQLKNRLVPKLPDEHGQYLTSKTDAIIQGVNSIDKVTSSLREFTSQRPREYTPVDVNLSIRNAKIRHQGERIKITLDPQAEARALFDEDRFARVLDNLLVNAREAAEEHGQPEVSVKIRTWSDSAGVHIAVQDDAGGIKPEQLAQVFRPHISFKSGGSGLGLAHVKGMVSAASGSVKASNENDGALFTVILPKASAD